MHLLSRREFLYSSAIGVAGLTTGGIPLKAGAGKKKATVALVRGSNRSQAVHEVLKLVSFKNMKGKSVFVKPNFNTADTPPGSTHNDILSTLVREIHERDSLSITVGDRCGPGDTQKVMEDKGIFDMGKDLGFAVLNFEAMDEKERLSLPADFVIEINIPNSQPRHGDLPSSVFSPRVSGKDPSHQEYWNSLNVLLR